MTIKGQFTKANYFFFNANNTQLNSDKQLKLALKFSINIASKC